MKILYIVLSCDKYVNSRCVSSEETWVKNINHQSDYIILSANSIRDKVIGYNTEDDYWSLPIKMLNLFRKFDFKDFEWVLILDDDAFCFPNRIEDYININKFDYNERISIGSRNCEFIEMGDVIFCGGSGTLLSIGTVRDLNKFLSNDENHLKYRCGDCALFDWLKKIDTVLVNANPNGSSNGLMNSENFKIQNNQDVMDKALTFHYCNDDDKHFLYKKYLL